MVDSQTSFPHARPGVSSHINGYYCVSALRLLTRGKETVYCVNRCQPHRTGPQQEQKDCKLASVSPNWTSVRRDIKLLSVSCKLICCKSCTYCSRAATKERRKSGYCKTTSVIKICEQCFLCRSIVFCKTCTKCPKCCTKSACRGQAKPVLGNLGSLGDRTQSSINVERGLHPTFPSQTKLDQVTHNHQLLCTSSQEPLPVGGTASADKQKCSRTGQKSRISGVLQPAIFGPKTKQQMETYTRSEQSQQIPQGRKIQNGDTRNDPDCPPDRGVVDVYKFQGRLFPYTHTKPIQKISEISCTGQNIPVQSTTNWSVHSSLGVTVVTKEVKLMILQKGIRIHQSLDDWLVRARPSLCPSVENPHLLYHHTGYSQSPTHSRLTECGSRQAIQARPDNSNRVALLPEVFQTICNR